VIVWLDEQLSPALARWLGREFDLAAQSVRDRGLQSATDPDIFSASFQSALALLGQGESLVEISAAR